jgi:hypothetical protein
MTSYNKGSPVGWSRGGGGRVTLNKRVPLGRRAVLSRRLVF